MGEYEVAYETTGTARGHNAEWFCVLRLYFICEETKWNPVRPRASSHVGGKSFIVEADVVGGKLVSHPF